MTEGSEERVTVRGKVPDREISERKRGLGELPRLWRKTSRGPDKRPAC